MVIRICVIPGAGYDKFAYWPLVESGIIPLSYRKKKDILQNQEVINHKLTVDQQYGVKHYARRILRQLKEQDEEVDLIGHSMGWVIAQPLLDMIAEERLDGLVRNVIGLTPAITGGLPKRRFYFTPRYLGMRSVELFGNEREDFTVAVAAIRQVLPDFNPRCTGQEVFRSLLQSVQGVIPESKLFSKEKMFVFYSEEDHVIPCDVTKHMLHRNGIANEAFSGYGGHSSPVIDIEGQILARIKAKCAELSRSQLKKAAE